MIDSTYKIKPFSPNFIQWVDEVYKNHDNSSFISTKKRSKWGSDADFLSQLHALLPKIAKKLPTHFAGGTLCDARSLEQSTSEWVALWKAQTFPCKTLLSLSGGLGIDDWAWAKGGSAVCSLDPNAQLNEWVIHNAKALHFNIERISITAEAYLQQWQTQEDKKHYDLIYIDPDRRPNGNRKSFDAQDYLPNVFEFIENHPRIASRWLIKLSPMVDANWIHNQFNCRTNIFSVGLDGEVKEMLVEVFPTENKSETMSIDAICLWTKSASKINGKGIKVKDTGLEEKSIDVFKFSDGWTVSNDSKSHFQPNIGMEKSELFIFEPSPTIFASGLQNQIPQRFHISAATPNHGFFVAEYPLPAAFGRSLRVSQTFQGSLRSIHQLLYPHLLGQSSSNKTRKKDLPQLNITPRSCGITTDNIKKILKIRDGGNQYLFITKHKQGFIAWLGEINHQ